MEQPDIPFSSFRFIISRGNRVSNLGIAIGALILLIYVIMYFSCSEGVAYERHKLFYRMNYYLSINVIEEYYDKWRDGKEEPKDDFHKRLMLSSFFDDITKDKKYLEDLNGMYNFNLFINLIILTIVMSVIYSIFEKKYPSRKYLACPYKDCAKSVLVYLDWTCSYCHNKQNELCYITQECLSCERELQTVYCEHCNREFKL